jgi:DNA-binding GntR family transcriptional regulator
VSKSHIVPTVIERRILSYLYAVTAETGTGNLAQMLGCSRESIEAALDRMESDKLVIDICGAWEITSRGTTTLWGEEVEA